MFFRTKTVDKKEVISFSLPNKNLVLTCGISHAVAMLVIVLLTRTESFFLKVRTFPSEESVYSEDLSTRLALFVIGSIKEFPLSSNDVFLQAFREKSKNNAKKIPVVRNKKSIFFIAISSLFF